MAVSQTEEETPGKTLHVILKTACRLRPHRYVGRYRRCWADIVYILIFVFLHAAAGLVAPHAHPLAGRCTKLCSDTLLEKYILFVIYQILNQVPTKLFLHA